VYGIEEQVLIAILQGPGMERRDGAIEGLGDLGDGRGTDRILEEGRE